MSIFDITYPIQVNRLLPPDKRKAKMLAWLNALTYPIQWCRDILFNDYAKGSYANDWADIAYTKGQRVRYIDNAVYENIQSVGNASGILPTNSNYWYKILDIFIGVNERVKYNGQIIMYEFALNKYFRVGIAPFIFITNNPIQSPFFISGLSEPFSSSVYESGIYNSDYVGQEYNVSIKKQNNYTINVPIALFNSLGATDDVRAAIVKAQAEKYNVYGMIYNIISY